VLNFRPVYLPAADHEIVNDCIKNGQSTQHGYVME
jgi:hypothetical protein